MDFMFDWEAEGDRFSFEDSDRFEEDSLCSWISEPESLCNNWRGWRKQNGGPCQPLSITYQDGKQDGKVTSLVELASQAVACHVPFEVVEHFYPPIPEVLQLRIAFWSFPENEEDIRLYSCLANGSADEFQKGDHLFKVKAVQDALQIGFHLSATVVPPAPTLAQAKGSFNVAVVFDRRRITSCNCTCSSTASWCAHVVALCLFRIHQSTQVCLRAPVSESLSRLHRDQLQKFAQYLISELPQQILPTAQRLLDELLSSQKTAINSVCGAPDPTAGPSASELTTWCLDEATLHENIHKTLIKFCVPSPIVFSDVNYLSSSAPPAAAEWQSLLRPLRGREPEGMWNLLSIVREMYKRSDNNATFPLLEIVTEEVLACEQLLTWWFNTKISASHNSAGGHGSRGNQNSSSSQHAASSLCDEIVTLWRLAALNPVLSPIQRDDLATQLRDWHLITIEKARKTRGSNVTNTSSAVKKVDIESFPGFKPAIEACQLDWSDYVIPGVTFVDRRRPYLRFTFNKGQDAETRKSTRTNKGLTTSQVSCSIKTIDNVMVPGAPGVHHHPSLRSQEYKTSDSQATDGAYSSSSEGFCDNDRRDSSQLPHDSDSDLGELPDAAALARKLPPRKRAERHADGKFGKLDRNDSSEEPASTSGAAGTKCGPKAKAQKRESSAEGQEPALASTSGSAGTSSGAGGSGTAAAALASPVPVPDAAENSGDEYQVYFYDTKAKVNEAPSDNKKKKTDEPNYFAGIRKIDNKQEILFARAEALHAHGHTREACKLAKQLAEEMLANPPDLTDQQIAKGKPPTTTSEGAPPQPTTGKGKKKKGQNNISSFASTTLAKAAFLCNVLIEVPECHHLAFQVGMFGLEMPRPPASSKALEVKLAYQESELVTLLKKIPLGPAELNYIRDRAEKLRDGKLKSRGEALLPLTLASFIFDSLCLPVMPVNGSNSRPPSRSLQMNGRQSTDEKLGFEAAVAALGLKANVSEADHPLLCEGTRRQRGDLAVAMLVHYKDDQTKLSKIMDKLLDKEVHQLYKAPSLATYLASSSNGIKPPPTNAANAHLSASVSTQVELPAPRPVAPCKTLTSGCDSDGSLGNKNAAVRSSTSTLIGSTSCGDVTTPMAAGVAEDGAWVEGAPREQKARAQHLEYLNLERKFTDMNMSSGRGARPKTSSLLCRYNSKDTDSSAVEEDGEGSADYKAWEAKFRCTNLKVIKKHSTGMASIDSSAPETTSSDNSPTLVRRNWAKHHGPGSDSGSSGKSSDSLGSSSSGDKGAAAKLRDNESPTASPYEARYAPQLMVYSRSSTPNVKGVRYKGKNRIMPTVPNQPSEASAHFMFELAKTVLTKAGGNSSTSLFTQPANNNNPTGPHRALHLCAFQIGLYALGLHNCVSPNWLSRTYSSHVSWITGQAMEIGSAAINILIDTWEGHLTPQEVASLADRASRGRDPNMVRAAAELALSCLPHAQALNPNEIQRALIQCKEQSREMLERASLAVESAAKGGGVYPEVLFDVAKRWYELYEEALAGGAVQHAGRSVPAASVAEQQEGDAPIALVQVQPGQVVMESNSPPVMQLMPAQQVGVSVNGSIAPGQPPMQAVAVQGQAVTHGAPMIAAHNIPYTIPPPSNHSPLPHHPYIAPYSYVQQVPPNFAHHYSAPHIPLHTHNMHPSYMATYPYNQAQQAFANVPVHLMPNAATLYHANVSHLRPPPPQAVQVYSAGPGQVQRGVLVPQNVAGGPQVQLVDESQAHQSQAHQAQAVQQDPQGKQQQQTQQAGHAQVQAPPDNVVAGNSVHANYLLAAYRVGMLAMETLGRRVHDDRPQTKYARNPPYGEDVKWLLAIAIKLGATYLQQFCATAVNAIVSPFVLHDIALESAHYLARSNPAQVSQQLRSPMLNSLVQKCLQMFIQCTHQRLHHIPASEYDDFVGIVCSARNAFCLTPGGMVHFNELLQSLRRSKSCKKELWQRILNGLHTGNI